MLKFFMPMNPPTVTAQERKVKVINGRPMFYEPEQVKAAKKLLSLHLMRYRPDKPYDTGVRLFVAWGFPTNDKHKNGKPRITKPDTDNLQKMLKDCMTKCGYWTDDALVAEETCHKYWTTEEPGIYIAIAEIPTEEK